METRAERDATARRDAGPIATLWPARAEPGHDRMGEIRRRIADDAYRSPVVAEEIARRILLSRDL